MSDKQALMHLISRAERGALLAGEAQLLREAIELMDEMAMTLEYLTYGKGGALLKGYHPTTTQEIRVADVQRLMDDDAPGRP